MFTMVNSFTRNDQPLPIHVHWLLQSQVQSQLSDWLNKYSMLKEIGNFKVKKIDIFTVFVQWLNINRKLYDNSKEFHGLDRIASQFIM